MRKPFTGTPVAFSNYTAAKPAWHLWGALGGIIWCAGLSRKPDFVAGPTRGTGCCLRHRPGRHHDLRCVGSLYLAEFP